MVLKLKGVNFPLLHNYIHFPMLMLVTWPQILALCGACTYYDINMSLNQYIYIYIICLNFQIYFCCFRKRKEKKRNILLEVTEPTTLYFKCILTMQSYMLKRIILGRILEPNNKIVNWARIQFAISLAAELPPRFTDEKSSNLRKKLNLLTTSTSTLFQFKQYFHCNSWAQGCCRQSKNRTNRTDLLKTESKKLKSKPNRFSLCLELGSIINYYIQTASILS